jgi:hypothetical protein
MAALDIKHLFRLAWERTKETEKVKDGDPAVEYIEGTVIRMIAELDFARFRPVRNLNSIRSHSVLRENAPGRNSPGPNRIYTSFN